MDYTADRNFDKICMNAIAPALYGLYGISQFVATF